MYIQSSQQSSFLRYLLSILLLAFLRRVQIVFKLNIKNLFLTFCHFGVQGFQGLFKHSNILFQRIYSFRECIFNQYTSNNFPTFSFTLQWLDIGQNQVVFSTLLFQFDVAFKNFGILCFQLVISVHHFFFDLTHLKIFNLRLYVFFGSKLGVLSCETGVVTLVYWPTDRDLFIERMLLNLLWVLGIMLVISETSHLGLLLSLLSMRVSESIILVLRDLSMFIDSFSFIFRFQFIKNFFMFLNFVHYFRCISLNQMKQLLFLFSIIYIVFFCFSCTSQHISRSKLPKQQRTKQRECIQRNDVFFLNALMRYAFPNLQLKYRLEVVDHKDEKALYFHDFQFCCFSMGLVLIDKVHLEKDQNFIFQASYLQGATEYHQNLLDFRNCQNFQYWHLGLSYRTKQANLDAD